jgi:hypothetical protein
MLHFVVSSEHPGTGEVKSNCKNKNRGFTRLSITNKTIDLLNIYFNIVTHTF